MKDSYKVLIAGGGSAGITVAAHLLNANPSLDVGIIEPSDKHYYQPLWTLVGGGVFPREETERNEADYIPAGADWIQDKVASFDPEQNTIKLEGGQDVKYEYLIVALGIQVDWDKIKGLKGNLGKHGICSNYSYDTVESTWENVKNLKSGNAVFVHPVGPIKCAGAPQKICYLAEDHFRKRGVREDINVIFASAAAGIFGVPKYKAALEKVVVRKGIDARFGIKLTEVRAEAKEAVFEGCESGEEQIIKYDMLHVVPTMSSPRVIQDSPLAAAEAGWVDVDMYTMQHVRYDNVFSLGDCSSLPTSKTGAAIRKQAPILAQNLQAAMAGKPLEGSYDGYTSCPLVTGYGSLILAEFDYDGQPAETFPFNQAQERYSMYALKAYGLPRMYWHGMLRGRA